MRSPIFTVLLCGLAITASLVAEAVSPTDFKKADRAARTAYAQAEQAYVQKNYKRAYKACQTGLKLLDGQNTLTARNLYNLQAHALWRLKDFQAADRETLRLLELSKESGGVASYGYGRALVTRGQFLLATGRFSEAQKALTQGELLLRKEVFEFKSPEKEDLYRLASMGLVVAYAGQENEIEARKALRTILMVKGYENPTEYAIAMGLVTGYGLSGCSLYHLGQADKAQILFEKALQAYDDNKHKGGLIKDKDGQVIITKPEGITATYALLSQIYEKQGRKSEAQDLKNQAIMWARLGNP